MIRATSIHFKENKGYLNTILHQAGFALSDVIQLKYYTTDVTKFSQAMTEIVPPIDGKHTSTLLGVTALFHSDIMVEIEAVGVK